MAGCLGGDGEEMCFWSRVASGRPRGGTFGRLRFKPFYRKTRSVNRNKMEFVLLRNRRKLVLFVLTTGYSVRHSCSSTLDEDNVLMSNFGPPVAWYRHEVDAWVHTRVRAGTRTPAFAEPKLPKTPVELIRFSEVQKRTGLPRSSIADLERRGLFPRRVLLHSHG
jgi:predicted DNA-binding transcriptional regulator AlpA